MQSAVPNLKNKQLQKDNEGEANVHPHQIRMDSNPKNTTKSEMLLPRLFHRRKIRRASFHPMLSSEKNRIPHRLKRSFGNLTGKTKKLKITSKMNQKQRFKPPQLAKVGTSQNKRKENGHPQTIINYTILDQ